MLPLPQNQLHADQRRRALHGFGSGLAALPEQSPCRAGREPGFLDETVLRPPRSDQGLSQQRRDLSGGHGHKARQSQSGHNPPCICPERDTHTGMIATRISNLALSLESAGLPRQFALAEAFAAETADWCDARRETLRSILFVRRFA